MPNGLIYPLSEGIESNPLRYLTNQNRFGTFTGGVPAKVATRSRLVHDLRHVHVGKSGRPWQDPVTGKAQMLNTGTARARGTPARSQSGKSGSQIPVLARRYPYPGAPAIPTHPGTYLHHPVPPTGHQCSTSACEGPRHS